MKFVLDNSHRSRYDFPSEQVRETHKVASSPGIFLLPLTTAYLFGAKRTVRRSLLRQAEMPIAAISGSTPRRTVRFARSIP